MSGPYELLDEAGRGGAGVVLRARGPGGALVAVKLLLDARAGDGQALARFARERRLQAWLGAAQGFVPLLDHGVGPRGPYLVMPFLPGGTLRDRLRRGPLPVDEAAALARRLARAMALAHAQGVVHRDLKPENVLFTAEGDPLVGDLGLARHLAPDAPDVVSRSREFRGTLGYTAPEQLDCAARAGPPADVFALGAILHECLTGRPAFGGQTELERIARTRAGRVEPLRSARPEVPAWLADVVARALAPRPEDRYPHAGALARALAGPRRSGSGRRARTIVATGALAALGLAAALAWPTAAPPPPAPPPPTTAARVAAAADLRRAGQLEAACAALDEALRRDPLHLGALLARGRLRQELGDLPGARRDLDHAALLHAYAPAAWARRALVRLEQGDVAGGFNDAAQASRLDNRVALARLARGAAWVARGLDVAAIAELDAALGYDAGEALILGYRALARRKQGDAARERLDLERALELDPHHPWLLGQRGITALNAGQFDAAEADFARAVALAPRSGIAWANLGGARLRLGRTAAALEAFDRGLEVSAPTATLSHGRGVALAALGRDVAAEAELTRALAFLPGDPVALELRAGARAALGDVAGAIDDLDQALKRVPDHAAGLEQRGTLHLVRGDHDQALRDLDRALALDASSATAYLVRGAARARAGQAEAAVEDLARFLDLAPDHERADEARELLRQLR